MIQPLARAAMGASVLVLIAFAGTFLGWRFAFALLAIGPFLGLASMLQLRRLPEAERLAGGRK